MSTNISTFASILSWFYYKTYSSGIRLIVNLIFLQVACIIYGQQLKYIKPVMFGQNSFLHVFWEQYNNYANQLQAFGSIEKKYEGMYKVMLYAVIKTSLS